MEQLNVYCPLSGKNCTTACAWYTDDDCNFGNLYIIANKTSDMVELLEEVRDSIDNLTNTIEKIDFSS